MTVFLGRKNVKVRHSVRRGKGWPFLGSFYFERSKKFLIKMLIAESVIEFVLAIYCYFCCYDASSQGISPHLQPQTQELRPQTCGVPSVAVRHSVPGP